MFKKYHPQSYSAIARKIGQNQLRQYIYYNEHAEADEEYETDEFNALTNKIERRTERLSDLQPYLSFLAYSYRCERIRIRAAKYFMRHGRKYIKRFEAKPPFRL